jgi:hypothetical protein
MIKCTNLFFLATISRRSVYSISQEHICTEVVMRICDVLEVSVAHVHVQKNLSNSHQETNNSSTALTVCSDWVTCQGSSVCCALCMKFARTLLGTVSRAEIWPLQATLELLGAPNLPTPSIFKCLSF